jgi:hypothetical protein
VQARHLEELSLNQLAPAINGRRLHGDHTRKAAIHVPADSTIRSVSTVPELN